MYEQFYNLRERPFSLTPDPDYLYLSRVHTEALSHLRYGIEGHAGFVVITGEIGSGKTTLLQTAMRGLDSRTSVARLVNTMLDARELIEAVMLDFGLDPQPGQSKPHLLRDLAQFLVEQRKAERLPLLIIDEAQNLSKAALEEVRMLSNLETEKSKLIQIILVGQPDLYDLLARPEFEQLRQRVTVRYHLRSLDQDEAAAYINHRLRKAAIGAPLVFSRDVTDLIGAASEGLPRKINVISDAVLLFGYGDDKHVVDAPLVREVIGDLATSGVLGPIVPRSSAAAPAPSVEAVGADTARAAADAYAVAKERELAAREAALVERERDLAEQRRVLAEQSQLLKRQLAFTPAADAHAAVWPPPQTVRVSPTSPGSNRPIFAAEPTRTRRTVWTRLARTLFGSTKPVFEE